MQTFDSIHAYAMWRFLEEDSRFALHASSKDCFLQFNYPYVIFTRVVNATVIWVLQAMTWTLFFINQQCLSF